MDSNTALSEVQPSNDDVQYIRNLTHLDPESMTGEDMAKLWEQIRTQDYAFDDFSRNRPAAFIAGLTESYTQHYVAPGLYCVVRSVWEGSNCTIGFVVWDRTLSFQVLNSLGEEIINHLLYKEKVQRVSAQIPPYNALAKRFALAMGFKFEGEMRDTVLYKGSYHNAALYGLLKKDWEARMKRGGNVNIT